MEELGTKCMSKEEPGRMTRERQSEDSCYAAHGSWERLWFESDVGMAV